MTASTPNRPARLPWHLRLVLILAGSALLGLLLTAALLRPASAGLGTHQQLGLPPCSFRVMFQMRCPSCGMTTSWAHLVRGHLVRSLQSNTGGTLLALVAMWLGPWSLASGVRGRWFGGPPRQHWLALLAVSIVVVTLVDWCVRLAGSG